MAAKKSRGWLTLIYPESEVAGWKDALSLMGQSAVISPLHDKDLNATGEQKKAHRHVLLIWEGPTTYNNAKEIVTAIGGVGCIPAASIRGSVRYFCHLDNPEKAQYSKEDLQVIGDVNIDEIITSESDDILALSDMYQYISDNDMIHYKDFVDYCRQFREDWFRLITVKYRENVYRYMRSMEYKKEQEKKEQAALMYERRAEEFRKSDERGL